MTKPGSERSATIPQAIIDSYLEIVRQNQSFEDAVRQFGFCVLTQRVIAEAENQLEDNMPKN